MPAVCRIGDTGVGRCPHHLVPQNYVTVFSTGATDVTSNDSANCIIGTVGISTCGHPTVAITGSENSTADGQGLHRVDDVGANYGPYVAITGSDNVTSE